MQTVVSVESTLVGKFSLRRFFCFHLQCLCMVSVLYCIPLQNQVGHSSWQGICSLLSEVCHQPSSAWVGDMQNVIRLERYLMASFCVLWAMVQILEDPWGTSISWIDSQVICERWSITGQFNNFECCVWRVSFQVGGCYLLYNVLIWDWVVPKIDSKNYYVFLIVGKCSIL